MLKEGKMAELDGIYRCNVCGNVVSVLYAGAGELVCCGQPMEKLTEKTAEQEGKEKHVPLVEKTDEGVIVRVGSIEHPMEEKHFINLIQLLKDGRVIAEKRLYPGDKPKAKFCCVKGECIMAREVCNVHGMWKG